MRQRALAAGMQAALSRGMTKPKDILLQRRAALAHSYALHCDELSTLAARHPDWPIRDATQMSALMHLTAKEHAGLGELEWALGRLEQGRYGLCERCGASIDPGKLREEPVRRECGTC